MARFLKVVVRILLILMVLAGAALLVPPFAGIDTVVVEDETTAINSIKTTNGSQDAVYTLQGVRTNSISKGIYIINGKKVFKK